MLYENTLHTLKECDLETMDFLRGFAQYNNYTYEVHVGHKTIEGITGEQFTEQVYDILVVCPEYRWNKIMQEV